MKYTKTERLEIGRRIYESEITRFEAASEYSINSDTARQYMRMYRDEHHLPSKRSSCHTAFLAEVSPSFSGRKNYDEMTREELIMELILTKASNSSKHEDSI